MPQNAKAKKGAGAGKKVPASGALKKAPKQNPGGIQANSSNLHLTCIRDVYRNAIQPPSEVGFDFVNVDKGVIIDPFEHSESNQYLRKTDSTELCLQAKTCITKEKLSTYDMSKKTTFDVDAVQRVMWNPPCVKLKSDAKLYADTRGVFSDLLSFVVRLENILNQPIVVTLNSPRSRITEPEIPQFRDFQRKLEIKEGQTKTVAFHWRDSSNVKSPLFAMLQTEKPITGKKYTAAELVLEVLDFLVEYPSIDRESNSAYDIATEVIRVKMDLEYVVNVNYPLVLEKISAPVPFFIVGSDNPVLDLFGVKGFASYVPNPNALGLGDVGDPKWISLRESERPFVGIVVEGGTFETSTCYLAGLEADYKDALPLHLSMRAGDDVRLFVPGLALTRPIETDDDWKSWNVYSIFKWDRTSRKWYLWDELNGRPLRVGGTAKNDQDSNKMVVDSRVMGLLIDVSAPKTAYRDYRISVDDVIGFLDCVTRVVGIVSAAVGLFV